MDFFAVISDTSHVPVGTGALAMEVLLGLLALQAAALLCHCISKWMTITISVQHPPQSISTLVPKTKVTSEEASPETSTPLSSTDATNAVPKVVHADTTPDTTADAILSEELNDFFLSEELLSSTVEEFVQQ